MAKPHILPESRKKNQKKKKKPRKRGRPLLPAKAKVKRKQWSEEPMLAAIESIRDGTPMYQVAKIHGVLHSTFDDYT